MGRVAAYMKTIVISLSLLLLLLACGKTPEEPRRPGNHPVPRTTATLPLPVASSSAGESATLFGQAPVSARRNSGTM